MKTSLFIIAIAISFNSFSQRLKEIESFSYQEMISKENNKKFKNGMDILKYTAIDENVYQAGDTLVLGRPSGINTVAGPTGYDTRFEYLFYGKPSGTLLKGIRYLEGELENKKVIISKIQYNKGSLGLENYVFLYVKPLVNTDFTVIDEFVTVTMFDTALDKAEIFPLNMTRPMSRDEAIQYLKSKKEELDLEIITQQEYDKIKTQLMPLIKPDKN